MLRKNNNIAIDEKQYQVTEEALGEIISTTAGLAGAFSLLEKVSAAGMSLLDPQAMEECRQMMSAMNRILCEQEGRLQHLSLMQAAHMGAADEFAKAQASYNQFRS